MKQFLEELSDDWFPYNPIDDSGSMDDLTVTNYEWPFIYWSDSKGNSGKNDIRKGEGKLPGGLIGLQNGVGLV